MADDGVEGLADQGKALFRAGEYVQALVPLQKGLELAKVPEVRCRLLYLMSVAARRSGNTDEALKYAREGLDLHIVHELPANRRGLAHHQMGQVLMATGAAEEALVEYLEGKQMLAECGDDQGVAMCHEGAGRALLALGKAPEALAQHLSSLGIRTRKLGARHLKTGYSHLNLGETFLTMGEGGVALRHLELAAVILTDVYGEEHLEVALVKDCLGDAYAACDQEEKAREAYEQVYAIRRKLLGEDHHLTAASQVKATFNGGDLVQVPSSSSWSVTEADIRSVCPSAIQDITASEIAEYLTANGLPPADVDRLKIEGVDGPSFCLLTLSDLADQLGVTARSSQNIILRSQHHLLLSIAEEECGASVA